MGFLKDARWWLAIVGISVVANIFFDSFIIIGTICVVGSIVTCLMIDKYGDK